MKITQNFEIPTIIIFLILMFLAFWFRETFGTATIHLTFILLFIVTFLYLFGSGIVNSAKVKTPKIIGDGIRSTTLSSKRKELSNGFYAFSLGAFEDDDLMLKSMGKDGIVIVHKDSFEEIFESIKLFGITETKLKDEINFDWQIKIKEHFGYLPFKIQWIQPNKEYNEISMSEIKEKYITDLNHRNTSLSFELNQLKSLLEGMGTNMKKQIQNISNLQRIGLKPFKKEITTMNKENK